MRFTNAKTLCLFAFICATAVACKKTRYNYKCLTSHSTVNNDTSYTFQRIDTTYLKDVTTKEAFKYERENTFRATEQGADATSTVCRIIP